MDPGLAYRLGQFSRQLRMSTIAVGVFVLLAVSVILTQQVNALVIAGMLLIGLAIVTVASMVEIVDATEQRALTILGEFRGLLSPGIHVIPPFVSSTHRFDMRTQTLDVPRQEAITRDNSPVRADAVIYIRVMDAKKAYLEVDNYKLAVSNLAQTTLRAVLGDMDLDDTLKKREEINHRIHHEIDEATDQWGIRVEAVEVREVRPTRDVQAAMEEQTSAERRRRAMILEAQGERRSAIERAEGEKGSAIIRAQGTKQSEVLTAQGDAVATVLRARSAESMGERAVIDRSFEALQRIGTGDSTTFVLPQELSSLVGRYGRHLTGSDVASSDGPLEPIAFDADTEQLLGLDDIDSLLEELDAVEPDSATEHDV